MALPLYIGFLLNCFFIITIMFREGQARQVIGVLLQRLAKTTRIGATGGASKASDRCSFTKISENNKDWCNGRGKQGKDALACVPIVSHGCETKKHTQTLTLRKATRIVQI